MRDIVRNNSGQAIMEGDEVKDPDREGQVKMEDRQQGRTVHYWVEAPDGEAAEGAASGWGGKIVQRPPTEK